MITYGFHLFQNWFSLKDEFGNKIELGYEPRYIGQLPPPQTREAVIVFFLFPIGFV